MRGPWCSNVSDVSNRLTRKRFASNVGKWRSDNRRWGRRLGDGRGRAPPSVDARIEPASRVADIVPTVWCGSCFGLGRTVSRCVARCVHCAGSQRQRGSPRRCCRRRRPGGIATGARVVRLSRRILSGAPDAERPPATRTGMAVAAKRPVVRAHRCSLGVALVVAAQITVANQRADHLAMGTRQQLEPLSQRVPFLGAATKPSLLAHVRTRLPRKSPFYRRGVDAGYD